MAALLIILDGFGLGKEYPGNAYFLAKKPNFEKFFKKYPWTKLKAAGNAAGVPEGTQGGSEIGHFTIGAGRVTWHSLEEINRSIKDGSFFEKKALKEACSRVKEKNTGIPEGEKSALHLVGMVSNQGVHSHIDHLFALLELAKKEEAFPVFIHAILDGRDVPGKSASGFITQILQKIKELELDAPCFPGGPKKAQIATMVGRYFAMDRDKNWNNRIEKAYDLLTLGLGKQEKDPLEAVSNAYDAGAQSDYYIEPIILQKDGIIKDKDAVIFWNFRTDRARELTWCFTGETPPKETGLKTIGFTPKKTVRPFFVCMGPFSEKAPVVFETPAIKNNLGEALSKHGMPQLRIAETQKYAHVTFFFNSQVEHAFPKEERILIPSPKTIGYAKNPEMSAYEVTKRLISEIKTKKFGFIAVNFANCDLVGHSGELSAAIKAVEVIDECLGKIIPEALGAGDDVMITGDHGNVEYMLYENGEKCPSHTVNPVPFILISEKFHELKTPAKRTPELQDIAPTALKLLDLPKPAEMTGVSLI